jgi:hypothetical protein
MKIIKMMGGLGNQLFQAALGISLTHQFGETLKLDLTFYDHNHAHQGFELQRVFNFDFPVATEKELKQLIGWRKTKVGRNIMARNRFSFLRGKNYYKEIDLGFNKMVFSLPDSCYLDGFWQTEKYFFPCSSEIRKQYNFITPLTNKNREIASKITNSNSVSLHVRLGDYVSQEGQFHGVCSLDYYEKAMQYVEERISNPTYFVFSDDIESARKFLRINRSVFFVDYNHGQESFNDMRLMSLCRNHIIANSSFSWWGAWLNREPDKLVVAPNRWFMDERYADTDHVLDAWIAL